MKIKLIIASIVIVSFTIIVSPNQTYANTVNSSNAETIGITQIQNRIIEIKQIDTSSLSPVEKRKIKSELLKIKDILQGNNDGVYISIGSLLVIIILLILIF